MISLDTLSGIAGSVVKGLGVATALGSTYVALGLPLPATVQYVDGKIATVVSAVSDVKTVVLQGQMRDIASQRALLRNEKTALTRTMEKAGESGRLVLTRRLGEIEDALVKLTREEDSVASNLAAQHADKGNK